MDNTPQGGGVALSSNSRGKGNEGRIANERRKEYLFLFEFPGYSEDVEATKLMDEHVSTEYKVPRLVEDEFKDVPESRISKESPTAGTDASKVNEENGIGTNSSLLAAGKLDLWSQIGWLGELARKEPDPSGAPGIDVELMINGRVNTEVPIGESSSHQCLRGKVKSISGHPRKDQKLPTKISMTELSLGRLVSLPFGYLLLDFMIRVNPSIEVLGLSRPIFSCPKVIPYSWNAKLARVVKGEKRTRYTKLYVYPAALDGALYLFLPSSNNRERKTLGTLLFEHCQSLLAPEPILIHALPSRRCYRIEEKSAPVTKHSSPSLRLRRRKTPDYERRDSIYLQPPASPRRRPRD
ncbi:transcription elongation factor GreA [Striga asiatica]|uniref:Transcription elongation factor GreA n=1 Tax=Striga asiatica TaxID=4170 RepID=A0A5A7QCB3_STRAF|nr:transcription elongation factor GreA [Striga asiatica]